jgi:hypothetical protein
MVMDYHNAPSEFQDNPAMAWGRANEATAIGEFELETGFTVDKCGFFAYEDWLGASPDGIIDGGIILENKCPYGIRNKPAPVPFKAFRETHYYGQVQIEMLCAGRRQAVFNQWTPNGSAHEFVPFNRLWLSENLPRLRAFYDLYLSELDNPAHLEPKRKEYNSPRLAQMVAEYDDMCEAEDRAKERKSEIMEAMQEAVGFQDALIHGRKLTKVTKSGSVSYAKAFKDLMPKADLTPYTGNPSEYWKLT